MKKIISKSNLRFFLIPVLFLIIFVRCDEDEIPFPYVSVYANLSLNTQLGNVLAGNYVIVDGYGVGGLIIYRADINVFLAFDRACTHEASGTCILTDDGSMFECPCCGSRFWMVSNDIAGTVYQGPARYPLKQYKCTFDGVNTVRVTN
ncbi:MAG: Rieske 2Fe-2S domain-containing protein [Bacteroidales bacterium]|nr:Rieske 2Fe-2S domain-containing protein [Bacteroidales bacterium]